MDVINSCIPSHVLAEFVASHPDLTDFHEIFPTDKAPRKISGIKLLSKQFFLSEEDENDNIAPWKEIIVYISEGVNLQLVFELHEELEWEMRPLANKNDCQFIPEFYTKIRVIRTYKDAWNVYAGCEKHQEYIKLLQEVGNKLGDPMLFWVPL